MPDVDLNDVPIDETPTSDGKVVVSQDTAGTPNLIRTSKLPAGVTVEDANADGEPIAYDQFNALLGDLKLSSVAPSLELHDTNGLADQRRWVLDTGSNSLDVNSRTDSGDDSIIFRIFKELIKLDPLSALNVVVDLVNADSVIVPAATAANHAAQVSAIDATTGQLQIGGIEMGDTGWRDVTSVATTPTSATTFKLLMRRVGAQVFVKCASSAQTVGSHDLLIPATGFRAPYDNTIRNIAAAAGLTSTLHYSGTTNNLLISAASSGYLRFNLSWVTEDDWPASLPGS